ncbi:MAG: arginine-tRNA-protein transferase [Verrucomicrobiales bacterium]|nr:arginine-tRNA-protein transferase [Verrucomicrobiales bacterium]
MKLLLSEARADYTSYVFGYAVWGIPESGESPADCFAHGFLPGSRQMDRYYLCRHLRVDLRKFELNSENRRILRKGEGIEFTIVEKPQFQWNSERRTFCKTYADERFGEAVMTEERLDSIFTGEVTSHVAVFKEAASGRELGIVPLFLQTGRMAYYYYGFYDLAFMAANLGMFMMTCMVNHFWNAGFPFIYLGTCYSDRALYKTQFKGIEFFNGNQWSGNIRELKYLLARDKTRPTTHLLEEQEYMVPFQHEGLTGLIQKSKTRTIDHD